MAILYVDSAATGTDDGSSKVNAAPSLDYLINTVGISGENTIYFSHTHSYTRSLGTNYQVLFPGGLQELISINFTDDSYTPGAFEQCSDALMFLEGTNDAGCIVSIAGIGFYSSNEFNVRGVGCVFTFRDCDPVGSNHNTDFNEFDGSYTLLENCGIAYGGGVFRSIRTGSGSLVKFSNCRKAAAHGASTATTLFGSFGNGGGHFECENSDLSTLFSTGESLVTASTASDRVSVAVKRCKLPLNWTYTHTPPSYLVLDITESDVGDGYYYFFYKEAEFGQAEIDTVQYIIGGPTYDGSNNFSAQIDTGPDATAYRPFKYKLATFPSIDLTTNRTIFLELAGPASKTDATIWIEVEIQDVTDQALGVIQSSQAANPESGTALPSSSAGWASAPTAKYKISHSIGAQAGLTNSNVSVYLCVGEPNLAALNASMPTISAV